MNTMTIAFEDRNMMSVIRNLINSMKGVRIVASSADTATAGERAAAGSGRYRISPKIRAMESGYSLPDDLSDDYKKEIGDFKAKNAL